MARDEAVGNHADQVGHPRFARNAPPGGQHVVDSLGEQGPVGDLPLLVVAVPGAADGDAVGERLPVEHALHGQRLQPGEDARDAHAELRGGFHQVDVVVARRAADLAHVLPDLAAVVHFQLGELGHVDAVGVGPVHIHPADALDRRQVAQVPRPPGRLGLLVVDLVEIPDAGDEPDVVQPALVLGAGRREDVAVAGCVDHLVGQHGLAPRLALEDDPLEGVAVHHGVDRPTVQEQIDVVLDEHLEHDVLEGLGVDGRIHARPAVDDPPVELLQALHHLLADPLANLLLAGDDVPDHQQHQPAGPQAAEMPVPLHERHVGPGSARGHGRGHAGRAGPDDEHVGLAEHGQFALGLDHVAVGHAGGRAVGIGRLRAGRGRPGRAVHPGSQPRSAEQLDDVSSREPVTHDSVLLTSSWGHASRADPPKRESDRMHWNWRNARCQQRGGRHPGAEASDGTAAPERQAGRRGGITRAPGSPRQRKPSQNRTTDSGHDVLCYTL